MVEIFEPLSIGSADCLHASCLHIVFRSFDLIIHPRGIETTSDLAEHPGTGRKSAYEKYILIFQGGNKILGASEKGAAKNLQFQVSHPDLLVLHLLSR